MVSFRLGGSDGVSVEAAKWGGALALLGFAVTTIAGEGTADHLLPGLSMGAPRPPAKAELDAVLADADLVVVENLLSLPLNPPAASVLAETIAGRPAILHHHDLPWQRDHLAHLPPPPDDPAWRHVTINELSRRQLEERGIEAVTVYNTFEPFPPGGRRSETRAALGMGVEDRLVLQPTRALARKRVGAGLGLAEALGATFWLLGPAEDGYGPELDRLLMGARCPVRHGPATDGLGPAAMADAYAACDVVVLPSSWEGFGNPAVESATHRRPLAIGPYPVAGELARFGFEWFGVADPTPLAAWLEAPDEGLLDRNASVARRHFALDRLPEILSRDVLYGWDW